MQTRRLRLPRRLQLMHRCDSAAESCAPVLWRGRRCLTQHALHSGHLYGHTEAACHSLSVCVLQADLDKALPALDEAVSSLKSLSKNDIVEVKSLSNPPAGVKMVMDATCIMFDLKGKKIPDPNGGPSAPKITDYWDDAKKILNDPAKFLNSLMTFDKDNIPGVRAFPSCPCDTCLSAKHQGQRRVLWTSYQHFQQVGETARAECHQASCAVH